MSAERALLRRLVEWLDGTEGKVAWTGEQTLRDFVLPVTGIAEDARALLAEPEGEDAIWDATLMDGLSNDPPPDHDAFVAAQKYARASIRAALDKRRKPTPRSRAEAEAMVAIIRDMMEGEEPCYYDHHGYCQAHGWLDASPCPFKRAAALLAALTGEEK